jgi:hypothetical protein
VRVAPAFGFVETTFECDAKPAKTTLTATDRTGRANTPQT